jgi:hypothetical protein
MGIYAPRGGAIYNEPSRAYHSDGVFRSLFQGYERGLGI